MNKPTSAILDFGTDGGMGLVGADWVEEYRDNPLKAIPNKYSPGNIVHNAWVRPGTPIPVEDKSYTMIHTRYSMTHNMMSDWEFILNEFKRVLRRGGVIHMLESNSIDEEYNEPKVKALFESVFPHSEGWAIFDKYFDDGEEFGFQMYIYNAHESDGV